MTDVTPAHAWESRYAGSDAVWSGRVNQVLAEVAADLTPGRALDLGCGEGGDAIWLARRDWRVTGVDISPTAVKRAAMAATEAGLVGRIAWIAADLATWQADDRFDLVAASYLQSFVDLPRIDILRRAATWVAPGGHLLVVAHAAPPPWASPEHREHGDFPTPEGELAELSLPPDEWEIVVAEVRSREAEHHGRHGVLDDSVVLLRRLG